MALATERTAAEAIDAYLQPGALPPLLGSSAEGSKRSDTIERTNAQLEKLPPVQESSPASLIDKICSCIELFLTSLVECVNEIFFAIFCCCKARPSSVSVDGAEVESAKVARGNFSHHGNTCFAASSLHLLLTNSHVADRAKENIANEIEIVPVTDSEPTKCIAFEAISRSTAELIAHLNKVDATKDPKIEQQLETIQTKQKNIKSSIARLEVLFLKMHNNDRGLSFVEKKELLDKIGELQRGLQNLKKDLISLIYLAKTYPGTICQEDFAVLVGHLESVHGHSMNVGSFRLSHIFLELKEITQAGKQNKVYETLLFQDMWRIPNIWTHLGKGFVDDGISEQQAFEHVDRLLQSTLDELDIDQLTHYVKAFYCTSSVQKLVEEVETVGPHLHLFYPGRQQDSSEFINTFLDVIGYCFSSVAFVSLSDQTLKISYQANSVVVEGRPYEVHYCANPSLGLSEQQVRSTITADLLSKGITPPEDIIFTATEDPSIAESEPLESVLPVLHFSTENRTKTTHEVIAHNTVPTPHQTEGIPIPEGLRGSFGSLIQFKRKGLFTNKGGTPPKFINTSYHLFGGTPDGRVYKYTQRRIKGIMEPIDLNVFSDIKLNPIGEVRQQYRPMGYVVHLGGSVQSGHYVYYSEEKDEDGNDILVLYNDLEGAPKIVPRDPATIKRIELNTYQVVYERVD